MGNDGGADDKAQVRVPASTHFYYCKTYKMYFFLNPDLVSFYIHILRIAAGS